MNSDPVVLLVEDAQSLARLYGQYLGTQPIRLVSAATGKAALAALGREVPALVLLDLNLPDMDGMDILRHIRAHALPALVVIITANGSVNAAVEAMQAGAYDFIVKPFSAERLLVTVRNALERQKLSRLVDGLADVAREGHHGFIGSSLPMQALYRMIDAAAASRATVFITGQSGTGKEVCAEAIHRQSPRAGGPFVAINCGAIPRDLIESEIFGHVKGAFTGAVADRDGAAVRADGGTLFLDEVCEMDPALQTKMLRFLQTGTFEKVGGDTTHKVDIRIVCATNRCPMEEVQAGRFREDLFYRLHVVPIHLPPLRERDGDVIEIGRHLLGRYAAEEGKSFTAFAPEVEVAFAAYDWPGNVRELQNVIRNAVVLYDGETVTIDMLPPPLRGKVDARLLSHHLRAGSVERSGALAAVKPLWRIEREAIEQTIRLCDGNIPRAASLLEVSPSTLYRKRVAWQTAPASDPAIERKRPRR